MHNATIKCTVIVLIAYILSIDFTFLNKNKDLNHSITGNCLFLIS
nr:MAG TPA: hypothetical protein [Caudoviricetes sp.]